MPRVTIVTSVYNHARFLGERFRSVRAQTLQAWDWIVVDDASGDDSVATARRLIEGDNRITLLVNESNRGTTYTSARGFKLATGDYIYRADSDDSCHPQFLATLVRTLDANPRASFAACRSLYMNAEGRMWGNPFRAPDCRYSSIEALSKLVCGNFLNAPAILYRRSAVEQIGGFDATSATVASDWHLNMRMCLVGELIHLGDRLAYYRQHDSNISSLGRKCPSAEFVQRELFQPLDDIYTKYADNAVVRALPPIEVARKAQAIMVAKSVLGNQSPSNKHAECKEILDLLRAYVPCFDPAVQASPTLRERFLGAALRVVRMLRRA